MSCAIWSKQITLIAYVSTLMRAQEFDKTYQIWDMQWPSLPELTNHQFSSVQSLSHVQLFAIPWIAARQASLSISNSRSSLRLTSIESVMPSSHLILCRPLLLLTPIPPSIRVFSNESTLRMRWPKYWSFSFGLKLTFRKRRSWHPVPSLHGK